MGPSVLITGGGGYIGSIVVPMMLDSGYNVTVMDNFMYRQTSLLDVCYRKELDVVTHDVRDAKKLKSLVSSHDIIIPMAAIVGAPACDRDKELASSVNQTQIENIADWISDDQAVVFPVTNSGYGIGIEGKYCDEDTPLNPISHYGKTKVRAEQALLDNGNAVTLRLATVFGVSPRMRIDLLVNDFVYRAYKDRSIVLFESHFKRNYIHIRDVASAFLHSIDSYEQMKGNPYNVGLSDSNLSKMELCERIRDVIPDFTILESEIGVDPDKRNYIVSNARFEKSGWRPGYSLNDGILELLKLYEYINMNEMVNN